MYLCYYRQIALADRVLINKMDLVEEETLVCVENSVRVINADALTQRTSRSRYIHSLSSFSIHLTIV